MRFKVFILFAVLLAKGVMKTNAQATLRINNFAQNQL